MSAKVKESLEGESERNLNVCLSRQIVESSGRKYDRLVSRQGFSLGPMEPLCATEPSEIEPRAPICNAGGQRIVINMYRST